MMYSCSHCSKTFSRQYNLNRHITRLHPAMDVNNNIFAEEDDASVKLSSDDIGGEGDDVESLANSANEYEIDDDSATEEEDDDDDDNSPWSQLVKPALEKYADELNESMASYEAKGMSPEEVIRFAIDDLYYILKTDVKIRYGNMLNLTHELLKDEHHRKIMQDVNHFVKRGYAYKDAIALALKKNDDLFVEIVQYIDDDEEEEEEVNPSSNIGEN